MTEPPRRKRLQIHLSTRDFRRFFGFAVFALAIGLPGCGGGAAQISKPTPGNVAEFVGNAGITLPATAQPIGWREMRGMDDILWLQVRMPAGDVAAFLNNSPFKGTTLKTNSPYDLTHFREFWTSPPQRYRSGEKSLPNARYLRMVIDDSNGTDAIVYLMWNET